MTPVQKKWISAHERSEEIRDHILLGELDRATIRLSDFAVESNRLHRNEASRIRGLYSLLKSDERNFARFEDINRQRSLLIQQILELLDEIENYLTQEEQLSTRISEGGVAPMPRENLVTVIKDRIIFKCESITKSYSNFTLEPMSFEMASGEITALVGKNGSGKSTLLEMVACNIMPDDGAVYYPEFSLGNNDWHHFKLNFGVIPAKIPSWGARFKSYLSYTFAINNIRGKENTDLLNEVCNRLGMTDFKESYFSELSTGYQLRSALAVVFGLRPQLIIMDEPLANLDVAAQEIFLRDIKALAQSAKFPSSIIISSQHLFEVESIADNIILLDKGKVIYCGKRQEFADSVDNYTYEIITNQSADAVSILLNNTGIPHKIRTMSNHFIIETGKSTTSAQLISTLLENGLEVDYFRNISNSTKQFLINEND